uniref:DDE-1 domain-containing protein n=1 Tax=Amphimedon queenslandica TaxID=400682 RepID=A0A1X7T5C2_AMPQE
MFKKQEKLLVLLRVTQHLFHLIVSKDNVMSVFNLLDENNIFYILIPPNPTEQLQPLNLSVNKPEKDFVKSKFQNWYANIICTQLESGEEPVDMPLSIMKPLMSQWIIEMCN